MYHSEDMSEFIIKVFQDALQHHDKPEIFNTDQRSQINSILLILPIFSKRTRLRSVWIVEGEHWIIF